MKDIIITQEFKDYFDKFEKEYEQYMMFGFQFKKDKMQFRLNKRQEEKFNNFKESVKEKHLMYGLFDFVFTPHSIGENIKVISHLTKEELDLSEPEKM